MGIIIVVTRFRIVAPPVLPRRQQTKTLSRGFYFLGFNNKRKAMIDSYKCAMLNGKSVEKGNKPTHIHGKNKTSL